MGGGGGHSKTKASKRFTPKALFSCAYFCMAIHIGVFVVCNEFIGHLSMWKKH
jgi:hypothetical protein